MSRRVQILTMLCALSSLIACAPLSNVKPTTEKVRSVALPNPILFDASLRYAEQQNWTVDSSEQGLGWIEAVSEVDDSEGMTTRERWIISTRDSEIGIQLKLEFLQDGEWQSIDLVCDGYSYFRENQHLDEIAKQARSAHIASLPTIAATEEAR